MADLIARLLTEPGLAPVRRRHTRGEDGVRVYQVLTHDEDSAESAVGVPAIGDAWSPARPTLTVREIEARYLAGTDDTLTGTRGICHVKVTYGTGWGAAASPVPEVANAAYTRLLPIAGQVTVFYGIAEEELPGGQSGPPAVSMGNAVPINGGTGTTRNVCGFSVEVIKYLPVAAFDLSLIRAIVSLSRDGAINANRIMLPPILGVGPVLTMEPGEALYVQAQELEIVNGLVVLRHSMSLAEGEDGHRYLWRALNDKGEQRGPLLKTDLYRRVNFPQELFQ